MACFVNNKKCHELPLPLYTTANNSVVHKTICKKYIDADVKPLVSGFVFLQTLYLSGKDYVCSLLLTTIVKKKQFFLIVFLVLSITTEKKTHRHTKTQIQTIKCTAAYRREKCTLNAYTHTLNLFTSGKCFLEIHTQCEDFTVIYLESHPLSW